MTQGNVLVEQVTKEGQIIEGYDESLSPGEIYNCIYKHFPNIKKYPYNAKYIMGEYKGKKYAIRCKNVTYLGIPHPIYKKRIQIPDDLFDFYHVAEEIGAEPILLGIYHHQDNLIFVFFSIETYINKKANNSSAHIYVSDLAAATEDGYFQKIDAFQNTVTAIRPDVLSVYLDEFLGFLDETSSVKETEQVEIDHPVQEQVVGTEAKEKESVQANEIKEKKEESKQTSNYSPEFKDKIVPEIKRFFTEEEKEWHGIACYQKMIEAGYRNMYQPEWAGFYLEFEFEKFLSDNELKHLITYAQDKKTGGIDLDLFFPTIESYGDLKAHSEESRGIQGNDWNTIFSIINGQDEKSHVYYIVCEHSTSKDSAHDYEVTKYWNTAQNKSDLMSYSRRMKNSVCLKRFYILDINYSNKDYLTQFRQGLNSNGKPREPKIMIEQDNLQHFIIEQMVL